jgi:ABC-type lipoprotein release transport system permease subunit
MRIPVLAGRGLTAEDAPDAPLVVLMNVSAARRIFPGQEAVGQRIRMWDDRIWTIVGVVGDVRHLSPELDPGTQVYFHIPQMPDFSTLDLVVRSSLPVERAAASVQVALREVAPQMPTREWWTLEATVERATSARRFTLSVLSAFGVAALLLAGLGIYGVLAQTVADRAPEIGIRMALGASQGDVVGGVMRRTLALAGVGIAVGVLASLWAARLLGSLLYGVGSADPASLAGGVLVLLAVATTAAAVPALRAARVDGVRALRAE